MRAWLEVLEPKGADRELDPQRDFYVGRKQTNDLVITLPALGESQFIVRYEKESWRLIDLHGTPSSRIHINEAQMTDRHRLQDGDLVSTSGLRIRFREEQAAPTQTFDALRANLDDDTLWLVHADELMERGEVFGDYLARALRGEKPDHAPWLDEVFQRESLYGSLTLTWRRGVIESASIRPRHLRDGWELPRLRLLLQSRVAQFVRHLTFAAGTHEASQALAQLPELPPTLETIALGYRLSPTFRAYPPPWALRQRCPRLRDAPVFFDTPGIRLRGEQETVALVRATRLVRTPGGQLELNENPPRRSLADFFIDDANFWLRPERGTELNERELTGPVRLLLGDELRLRTGERFRVEPDGPAT